jgi:hypothetical protein
MIPEMARHAFANCISGSRVYESDQTRLLYIPARRWLGATSSRAVYAVSLSGMMRRPAAPLSSNYGIRTARRTQRAPIMSSRLRTRCATHLEPLSRTSLQKQLSFSPAVMARAPLAARGPFLVWSTGPLTLHLSSKGNVIEQPTAYIETWFVALICSTLLFLRQRAPKKS